MGEGGVVPLGGNDPVALPQLAQPTVQVLRGFGYIGPESST